MSIIEARGWAVVTNQTIDVRTVADTKRAAIVNWLVAGQGNGMPRIVLATHNDGEIEKMWQVLSGKYGATVVEVLINPAQDPAA